MEEDEKEMEKEVGTLKIPTEGVTIGPFAKDIIVESLKPKEITKINIEKIDTQNLHTVRQLFYTFIKENIEYAKIKDKFVRNEKTFAIVRQKFIDTIDSYFQSKRSVDEARDKLNKYRQIRQVLELEDSEKKDHISEIERTIEQNLLCYEKVSVNLEEEVNQIQNEINMLSSQRIEMKLKLECGFRKYCKQKNILLHCTEKLIKILLEPEVDNLKMIQYKFNKFQRMMLRKTQELERTKKVRFDKGICNSANT
ncbi:uncharacterized protein LOC725890 isoform X2 [Apis mellifera]|uniref:Uncharacterized protein LOC725890 isoform X2 n=1 Tax=Apis mellifera TaxID=7460 RepID=A0A7M7MUU0_APIME|nr:uncharacterized protein LOC725890 isoform X2 [Apis mellifera]|eukprot:XP_026301372.1 uncharacterized protein LOC725890 isoform X2 [Apis mellifera]